MSDNKYECLVKFWKLYRERIFDIDPEDGQELAEEAGLFKREEYSREKHGDAECEADDGDMLYFDRFTFDDLPPSPVIVPASLLLEAADAAHDMKSYMNRNADRCDTGTEEWSVYVDCARKYSDLTTQLRALATPPPTRQEGG
jgi:hypothetical protein